MSIGSGLVLCATEPIGRGKTRAREGKILFYILYVYIYVADKALDKEEKYTNGTTWALAAIWTESLKANGTAIFDLLIIRFTKNNRNSTSTAALT